MLNIPLEGHFVNYGMQAVLSDQDNYLDTPHNGLFHALCQAPNEQEIWTVEETERRVLSAAGGIFSHNFYYMV